MFRIKTMNKISPKGLARLDATRFEVSDTCDKEQAILVRSAKLHDYDFPADLLAIARAGAGVNNIPLERCAEAGIAVFNTPGANANAVKELAICALLLASRDVVGGVAWTKEQAKAGADVAAVVEKGKAAFAGFELMGKTLGIVGLGAIGIQLANVAVALGMHVVGYDPFLSIKAALALDPNVQVLAELPALYAASDYISLHLPMTDKTRACINAEAFAQMKHGVRIVNLARGELVHDADMKAALENGSVAVYATDFPNSEIALAPGVIPIPHLGASSEESEENCAMMAADELCDYLENGNITNSVNLPNLSCAWTTSARICVLFRSEEATLAKIHAAAGEPDSGCVETRGDYAYMICNLATENEALLATLQAIPGVLRVRLLHK